ncbi:MAG: acyloxyacyl hydrolase [Flavobacteriales bacterium]|nr:acyloxyacyl hydrolase [Flavobacteriales bacterium]
MAAISQDVHEPKKEIKIGASYIRTSQANWPFGDTTYLYETVGVKATFNLVLWNHSRFRWEVIGEPSWFVAYHQLVNPYYIGLGSGEDFLEQREFYTQSRTFNELVLSVGFIFRAYLSHSLSTYLVGTVGPMYGSSSTERLKDGLAFSDIGGLGVSYDIKRISLDFRMVLRHNSNANLWAPNSGHNSSGFEGGVSFKL